MKKILIILTFAFLSSAMWAQSEGVSTGMKAVSDWAAEGDQHYRLGNYEAAIDYYGMALGAGYTSAELYYNLGNAYYRTEQMGLAILNYERALRLKPTMSDARENLALAESKTVDRITVLPKFFLVRWIDTLCTHVSPSAWRIVWLVLLAIVGAAVVTMRMAGSRSLRKTGLVVGVLALLLLPVATFLLSRSTQRFNAHAEAVVLPQAINVKSSPELQSTDKLVLHEGTKLTISDSLAGWYKITIADGTTGWCQCSDIERI